MYYEPPQRRRPRRRQSVLDSPVLAGVLVIVFFGLAAVLFLPALFSTGGPTARATPTAAVIATFVGPTPSPTFAHPTPSPGPTFLTYTVKPGDTLNSIAKRYRTTARSIAWWNRGAYPSLDPEAPGYDPNTIRRGWKLVVMPSSVVDDDNPPTPSPGPTESPGGEPQA
jgi:hypothetical protein